MPAATRHDHTRRELITAGALAMAGIAARPSQAEAEVEPGGEISRVGEAIHQEQVFSAARKRVYDALTLQDQFDRIIQLSGVMKSAAMAGTQKPTKISPQVGSAFALFGGYIVGRQLVLVPDELIVQAWRIQNWARGQYSIARFEFSDQAGATRLVFDHSAFPNGLAQSLASGWHEHYWDPLAIFLGQGIRNAASP
jgi:activator of HSP90 ATPase